MGRVVREPEERCIPSPGNVTYEVDVTHDVDVVFRVTTGLQLWMTVAEDEPGAIDVDTFVVVNVL